MAITTPATIQITPAHSLWLPAMAAEPLKTALENINHLMQFYRPPLVSACYTGTAGDTTTAVYIIPVVPSQDGLDYTAEHRLVCSAASQSITITIDETATYAGGGTVWSNIASSVATTSATGGALTTHVQSGISISSTTEALRITYTAPASGGRTDHHLLVYPTPGAPTTGITASGATPFDDGMLASGDGSAIHTELINRCKATTVAVLVDRKQNALSFLQEETDYRYLWDATPPGEYAPLPPGRVWLPGQAGQATIDFRAIATVDAGAIADMVRIRQRGVAGGKSIFLDASGSVESALLETEVQGHGLMSYVDIEIAVKRSVGQETRLLVVMAFYTPGA